MEDQKIIINIGRQIGSGGRLIAKKLSEELNFSFYDRELPGSILHAFYDAVCPELYCAVQRLVFS